MTTTVLHLKSQLGGYVRRGNLAGAAQARRALEMAKREQAIRDAVEAAPPLDPDTLARVRALIPAAADPGDTREAA